MTEITSYASFPGLLGDAAALLTARGYTIQHTSLPSADPLLLAENAYFAVGIAEFTSTNGIGLLEADATFAVASRIGEERAKRWDAYLVLLSTLPASERGLPETIKDIVYNTRYLRRLVRWGVSATEESLSEALRPFLPLPPPEEAVPRDPVSLLELRMPSYGVNTEDAANAIAQWRASAEARDG